MIGRMLEEEVISLDHFRHWHEFQRVITESEWRRALKAIDVDESTYLDEALAGWLAGFTRTELDDHFETQLRELDLATILSLVAATEAALRREYERRADRRLKDAVSRKFLNYWKTSGDRIRLEDLLDVWSDKFDSISEDLQQRRDLRQAIANFKGILAVRHWLAHGRSWEVRPGQDISVEYVAKVSEVLFDLAC
jgi:hypothetical protein